MSLFSDFVPKSCSVILSLLKYANENTKRGTKSLNNYIVLGILLTYQITILYTFFGSQHPLSKT